MAYLAVTDTSILMLAQRLVYGLNSFTLLAVPLFILVGNLMDSGGISKRLTDWAKSILGWLPGGLGIVTVFSCAIFAALTGSGPATVAAIGSIMLPSMLKAGYSRETSAGLVAAAGALGPIIPPSIPMIIYGVAMNLSIPAMFVAGVVPGIVIALALALVNIIFAYRNPEVIRYTKTMKFDFKLSLKLLWKALGALALPVLILGGIYGGIFTPTESAAIGIVYALILGFALGELKVRDLPRILISSLKTSTMVNFIIAGCLPVLLGGGEVPDRRCNFRGVYQSGGREPGAVPVCAGHHPADCGLPDGQRGRHPDSGAYSDPGGHLPGLQRAAHRHAVLHLPGGGLCDASLR